MAALLGESGSPTAGIDHVQVEFLRRLLSARTATAAAQAAVDAVRELVSADVSWCGVVSGDYLTMAAYNGLRTTEMPALWRLRVGQGVGGRVAAEGRTIAVRDYRHDPRRVPVMKRVIDDEGIRSGVCAPLLGGTEILGVLYAAHRGPRDWTADEVRLVTDAGRDTGVTLALIREQNRDRSYMEEVAERARDAVGNLEVVSATATSLARTEDIGAGIGVLAHHLRMHVELLDTGGELLREASPGTPHVEEVQLTAQVGDEPLGALRLRGERTLTPAERELVEVCTHLIALQLLRERAALQSEMRVHSEFLDDLLEGRLHDRGGILARAALLGVDLRTPHHVVCFGLYPGSGSDPAPAVTRRTLTQVEEEIRRQFSGSIVVPRDGDLVVLLATKVAELPQVHQVLCDVVRTDAPDRLAAGLGRLCIALDDYAESFAEAKAAMDLARRRHEPGAVLSAADLGFYGLLVRGPSRQSLESIVERALGPILESDAAGRSEYVRSLDAFLANDRHLERTAASLHVHPNTVRYRLGKVQEMLGVNLRDVDDRFLLELALRVQAALHRR